MISHVGMKFSKLDYQHYKHKKTETLHTFSVS